MSDGSVIEVGKVETNHDWTSVNFEAKFSTNPITLSQCQTFNGAQAVVTRENRVRSNGFQVRLQEEEAHEGFHLNETVGYLAVQPHM